MAENPQNPRVTIEMESGGKIILELYPDKAPNTVRNFLSLVEKGFYNGLIFHRIIDGFMIQGGCPEGSGMGGPGYRIPGEFRKAGFAQNDLPHKAGVISMARSAHPHSAGSQFFICDGDAAFLDGDYAPFGSVSEGMEEVARLSAVPTDGNDRPLAEERMRSVTAETFGVSYPTPETL